MMSGFQEIVDIHSFIHCVVFIYLPFFITQVQSQFYFRYGTWMDGWMDGVDEWLGHLSPPPFVFDTCAWRGSCLRLCALQHLYDVFVGLAYYQGKKDIVFRFITEYSSLRDFYMPLLGNNNNNNRCIYFYIRIFERWYILACVETWD
jgi:hypothetical protein